VARAVKLNRQLLEAQEAAERAAEGARAATPSYSRVEVVTPAAAALSPFAEVEMPSGIKLRLYSQTQETLGLLSSLCLAGGAR
jgi:hypothetical protein